MAFEDSKTNREYIGNRDKAPNIVKLEDAKDWLKIKDSDSRFDGILNILIESVSQEFENYIDSPIIIRRFDEIFDGDLSDTIVPHNKPVRKINHLITNCTGTFDELTTDELRTNSSDRIAEDDYILEESGSIVLRDASFNVLGTISTGLGKGSILLDYEAGYASTVEDIPSDIKLVALQRIEHLYLMKENRSINVKTKRAGDSSVSMDLGLPIEIRQVLDRYIDMSFDHTNTRIYKYQIF